MTRYRIGNTQSGLDLGIYEGETPEATLDAMAQDAGYRDFEHSCEVTGSDGSEIVAVEIVDLGAAAAALGRKGGSVTSKAKQASSRANGRKGGRPRKAR